MPDKTRAYEKTETTQNNCNLHQHVFVVRILPVFKHVCENTSKRRFATAHHQQKLTSLLSANITANKLHARQSPTLARLAIPLAACDH